MGQGLKAAKEIKSHVFKMLTELKSRSRNDKGLITINDIRKAVNPDIVSRPEDLGAALNELDQAGQIHYDGTSEKIFM